ncbi:hypothetical protein ACFOEE_14485 [Pseudoalteromonas fenneropenaei]|uniref:Uncharacterized protein n=1 Tax=Pseudoalteromonas fenneropenaei TaxID=1737459 RepID=A0ABV7CMI4_9GAMM
MMKRSLLVVMSLGWLTSTQAAELNFAFTLEQMHNNGTSYEIELLESNMQLPSVLALSVAVSGQAQLTSDSNMACTVVRDGTCVGVEQSVTNYQLLHEAAISLSCDGKMIYQQRENRLEFTNEVISNDANVLRFAEQLVMLNKRSCQSLLLSVQPLVGHSVTGINGQLSFSDSTSHSAVNHYKVAL